MYETKSTVVTTVYLNDACINCIGYTASNEPVMGKDVENKAVVCFTALP